jgi:hypothetical protein
MFLYFYYKELEDDLYIDCYCDDGQLCSYLYFALKGFWHSYIKVITYKEKYKKY